VFRSPARASRAEAGSAKSEGYLMFRLRPAAIATLNANGLFYPGHFRVLFAFGF